MKIINVRLRILFILAFIVVNFGCTSKAPNENNISNTNVVNSQPTINNSAIVKVKVTQTGEIFLNEKVISLDDLKEAFIQLKKENGGVYYYRENPQEEPTDEAMSVIQAIIDAKLPVRISSKPDYSDFVDMEGTSKPTN